MRAAVLYFVDSASFVIRSPATAALGTRAHFPAGGLCVGISGSSPPHSRYFCLRIRRTSERPRTRFSRSEGKCFSYPPVRLVCSLLRTGETISTGIQCQRIRSPALSPSSPPFPALFVRFPSYFKILVFRCTRRRKERNGTVSGL